MTNTPITVETQANPVARETTEGSARGWYFYGITRGGSLAAVLESADDGERASVGPSDRSDLAPLELLEFSGLAAVVRPVILSDFSLAVLREHLASAPALEATVRSHNRVVESIHAQQAILPAKFGMVHTRVDEVVSALRREHNALVRQLDHLEGCDEWAVHLYADRALVCEQISVTDPTIRQLREKRDAARPGRAYFLEQEIRNELHAATELALSTLAQTTFERLAAYAVGARASQLSPRTDRVDNDEILRAAFLVKREAAEEFTEVVHASDTGNGLRCECSGPWPPYSFAAADDEEAR